MGAWPEPGFVSVDRYPVPARRHRVEQIIDRSRFVATIERAPSPCEARATVRAIEAEFPDATHHALAFVAGAPGTTTYIGMSDAGEPHGTAGRPMLTVLLHSGIGEIVAVCSRWYGGTKLGTGGLARAYGGTVQEALADLPTVERVELVARTVIITYPHVTVAQQLMAAHACTIDAQDFGAEVRFDLHVPVSQATAFDSSIQNATHGSARVSIP